MIVADTCAILAVTQIRSDAPDAAQTEAAYSAFVAFGKGSGHPASLNFGDVFSYALAKVRGLPLLFKGADFSETDLVSALKAD